MTNNDPLNSTFLDLDIFITKGKFHTKLYDKRRDFNFKVVTFPNLRSMIPQNPTYGVFVGELHRISKSCSILSDFITEVKSLIAKLVNQKFVESILYSKLGKFLNSKPACLNKYWSNLSVQQFMV